MTDNELEGIRVKSAIADKNQLTLYLENGDVRTVKQGDPRLPALIDQIMPIVQRGEVAVVSLQSFSVYAAFEEKTNGLVKFFKVAKKTLGSWFGKHTDEKELIIPPDPNPVVPPTQAAGIPTSTVGGYVPGQAASAPVADQNVKPEPVRRESTSRVDELSQPTPVKDTKATASTPAPNNSKLPTTATRMESEDVADDETVVAVIDGMVIPEIEKVKPYLVHALKHNSHEAVVAFLRRLIPMLDKRQHSIQDLLRFMQAGDLPIADDGSMIAYKILRKSKNDYVDCHTGRVHQRIGSYVTVDEKLVDLDRHNECSNGLHVARRAYIGGFGGDVVTLIKVAPEDVITVPHRDANKVRTKGYHILAELSREAYDLLKQNKSATKTGNTSELLAKILRGDHVAKLEEVRITQQQGNGIVVTQLQKGKKLEGGTVTEDEKKKAQSIDTESVAQVNLKEINQKIEAEKAKIAEEAKKASKPETKPAPVKASEKKSTTAADKPVDKVAEVLKHYDDGKGTTEISKLTGVARGTLGGWIKKHRTAPGKPKQ